MNKLYKNIVNFLVIVPFPNSIFGQSDNILTLAYLSFLLSLMLLLMGHRLVQVKMKIGLILLYLVIFSIFFLNITSLFAFTFYLRIVFAFTAGWFLFLWNSSSSEKELLHWFKLILYTIGVLSFFVFLIAPPEDGRIISLFDVHTSKYFFYAFVIIFTHQVLTHNRTSDYVALGFAFFLLSLSLQRGILLSTMLFLFLAFRERVFKMFTWIGLLIIACFQAGLFDPLLKRLFYETPTSGNVSDIVSKINSSGRLEFWTYLWENEKITFLGNGLGHSIEIGKALFPGLNLVHNDFLWLLIDVGIFGLAVFLFTFYYMYRRVGKQKERILKRVYLSVLFSIPLVMFVDNVTFHLYVYFPLLFGYFVFFSKKLNDERARSSGDIQLGRWSSARS